MFKKNTLLICFLLLMTGFLCSCADKEEVKDDQAFIDNLGKALEARWAVPDIDPSKVENSEFRNYLKNQCVQTELHILGSYDDYTFEDSHLADLAKQYFDALDKQYEGADYYGTDDTKYQEIFVEQGYNVRTLVFYELVVNYNLTVSDTYQSYIDEFNDNALKEQVQQILDNLSFEKTDDSYSWLTYTATIENTTDTTFSSFSVTVDLLDENGVVLEQCYCSIDHWTPGSKNQIEFITDKSFSSMNFTADYYEE